MWTSYGNVLKNVFKYVAGQGMKMSVDGYEKGDAVASPQVVTAVVTA